MKTTRPASSKTTDPGTKAIPGVRDIPSARTLKGVSDRRLLSGIRKLSETERKTVLSILVHLIEIERRKLYLTMGYSSLFRFCRGHLGYCESTAVRRIRVARCLRDFPESYRLLASGRIALSNVVKISGIITAENADELLSEIKGRSAKEVDLLVSRHDPKSAVRDKVTPVYVKTVLQVSCSDAGKDNGGQQDTASEGGKKTTANVGGKNPATSEVGGPETSDGRGCGPAAAEHPAATEPRIVLEQKFMLKFVVDPEFMTKVDRIRALLSTKHHTRPELEEFFSVLMDEYIERHSPEGRIKRKEKREQRQTELEQKRAGKEPEKTSRASRTAGGDAKKQERTTRAATGSLKKQGPVSGQKPEQSRYIPRKVRDEVYARDRGRCTFVSPGGRRCGSKWDLQIDHIVPFARGGDNSPDNLRLLCAKHNRLEAERAYGEKHMERYVKEHAGQYGIITNKTEKYVKEHVKQYVRESGEVYGRDYMKPCGMSGNPGKYMAETI